MIIDCLYFQKKKLIAEISKQKVQTEFIRFLQRMQKDLRSTVTLQPTKAVGR